MSHSSPSLSSCCFRTAGTMPKAPGCALDRGFLRHAPRETLSWGGDWAGVRTRLTLPCFLSSKCEAVATGLSVPDFTTASMPPAGVAPGRRCRR